VTKGCRCRISDRVKTGRVWALAVLVLLAACGDDDEAAAPPPAEMSNIQHLVVIIQENTSFDAYFAHYCTAPPGAQPRCTSGPACCEAGPATDPGTGVAPLLLDDALHGLFDPDHTAACFVDKIDGGKMDRYVDGSCGDRRNFAYADEASVGYYWRLARQYALADHWFQPVTGQSSANDMYFAQARFVFPDNAVVPQSAIGSTCLLNRHRAEFTDPTIGDLLADAGVPWSFYIQGYQRMRDAVALRTCPPPHPACPDQLLPIYPCNYDPSDIPFQYYPRFRDAPGYMRDFDQLTADIAARALPPVSFVKAIGFRSEHPGSSVTISDGIAFVSAVVDELLGSVYAADTLILVTYDESGGYFDHIAPPPDSPVDGMPYGPRVPTLALGRFARRNFVSHVVLEHSSIVKFIEWNWLHRQTGQLGNRDAVVNNIGSLLDPAQTGVPVPE